MKVNVIEGQIDLFSISIQEPIKPKEEIIIDKPKIKAYDFKEIIEQYKNSCNRIVKRINGALLVGFDDKTMYFNTSGKNEFDLDNDIGLMPGDEILVANKDIGLNDLQLSKLAIMDSKHYIKRKGDSNIIILSSKTTVINPKGWVIEYEQKPKYHENELFITKMASESTDSANKVTEMDKIITDAKDNEKLEIGDKVEFSYEDQSFIGKVVSTYNNAETINVSWNGKHTAFYYKCLKKIS
ncbi:hypothetical protein [Clostridium saccharoperbutylacetonicum]|uniref:hypothetical protein n=1 Tax=Clostridium saccharoperbutylacetonicum TaxID=36745 RepID=UPI000983BA84|nr:hypothetical protein [Clostridium saccharoperbutylacetonicum]AQR95539.1 hypothetical protein CLSAP_28550 [Clostridium saccharoperbutylacetonicum]NSB31399.1 hypothetical protein [Clostridium saccharoperbutylacetonicum]